MAVVPELVAQLAALRAHYLEVVAQMEQTAAAMRESGTPPDYHLLLALGTCHRQFLTTRHEVVQKAASLGIKIRSASRFANLRDVETFLETLTVSAPKEAVAPAIPPEPVPETEPNPKPEPEPAPAVEVAACPVEKPVEPVAEVARSEVQPGNALISPVPWSVPPEEVSAPAEPAPTTPDGEATTPVEEANPDEPTERDNVVNTSLHVLDTAARMTTRDGAELPALLEFHDEVRRIREVVASRTPGEWQALADLLASGKHPVALLTGAVAGERELSDSEWADVHAAVSETFGRPLAVALARHRLVVPAG